MSIPEDVAIRCEDLHKTYGSVEALKGLDLTVPTHSIFGLLGPNGAGKSTTIKLLTRQIAPTGGQAWVAGAPITGQRVDVRSRIGYLSEQPAFYPWMTGREFLDFIGELFGLSVSARRQRRDELLELVGLTGAGKRRIGGYSNGMRQRLGIAQTLINRPEVLLLDEPVSALDPIGRKEVLEMLGRLKGQCTIFFSSHILTDVDRICDEVAVLDQGELIVQAPTQALKEQYAQPVVTIELETDAKVLASLLEAENYVQNVEVEGQKARILVTDLEIAKHSLLACLVNAHLPVLRYDVARPTLEDVFVSLIKEKNA